MSIPDLLWIIFGFLLLIIIPGFSLSLVLFGKDKFTISERLYISSAINIFLVIAIALLLDLVLGVDITADNMVKSLVLVTVFSLFIWASNPRHIKRLLKLKI